MRTRQSIIAAAAACAAAVAVLLIPLAAIACALSWWPVGSELFLAPPPLLDGGGMLVVETSLQDLDTARRAASAASTPLGQPGPPHQRTSKQPEWAPHLAALAASTPGRAVPLIMTDSLTAALDGERRGWRVLCSSRAPCRALLVIRVRGDTPPVPLIPQRDAGGAWTATTGVTPIDAALIDREPVIMCYTPAEALLCTELLGARPDRVAMQPAGTTDPLSAPGMWALLVPLDSPVIATIRDLHASRRVGLCDYSQVVQSTKQKRLPAPVRTVFVESASLLSPSTRGPRWSSTAAGMRLPCAAFEYCVMCPAPDCGRAGWTDRLPDGALLDLGELAAHGLPVCGTSLAAAANRFASREAAQDVLKTQTACPQGAPPSSCRSWART